MSRQEKEEVQEFVEKQLRKGYIRPSKSPQTLPVFFVEKKDRKKQIVQDYQYLNKETVKDNYPLLLISNLIDTMETKRMFTKIDLRWGYNNVQIKEGDKQKATFTIYLGVYEPTIIFSGLTNLLATFQAMMNDILRDMINTGEVAAFMDNVLVGTEDKKRHDKIVEEMLRKMKENNLYIKPEKCIQKVKEIDFLGLVIGSGGIKIQEEKVAEVLEWLKPKIVKEVQKFLGLANYYRKFVKDFTKIAKSMHKLVRKDKKWNQGKQQEKAFKQLKQVFTTQLVLVVPDLDKEMRVEVDTSEYVTGGVLFMKCKDKKQRPVAFISKLLNEMEQNYKIHDREMLAIIRCLDKWRHLLKGAQNKFEIWSDHKNLEYFMSSQKLNCRQARWALYLSRFDFMLKHVLGSSMEKANSLSRRLDQQKGVERNNKNRTLLKREWLKIRAMQVVEVMIEGVDLLEKIRGSEARDNEVIKAVKEMKKAEVKMLRDEEQREENCYHKALTTQGPLEVSVQEELDRVLHWIRLSTYTTLQVAVLLLLYDHMTFQNIL